MFAVIMIYITIAFIEIPVLINEKQRKEFVVFGLFYVLSLVISLLYVLDIKIPNPYEGIRVFIEEILHIKYPEKP